MLGHCRFSALRGVLPRYYLFRLTNTSGFFLPVAILTLHDKGFGLQFIGLACAVYAIAKLIVEVPTGYVGDLLGRRAGLALGSLIRALVIGTYPFVPSTELYLAVHVLWAVGWAFRSGTQNAWLYEILQARFDESEFARIESRGNTVKLVTDSVTAVTGGVLYTIDIVFPFVGTALIALAGIPILYTFPRVDDLSPQTAEDASPLRIRQAIELLRGQLTHPDVRWFVVFAAVFYSLFVVTRIYEQPVLDTVGIPVAGLGVLYAGFKLVSAVIASTAGRVHDLFGTRGVMAGIAPVYAVAYASIAVAPFFVVVTLFLNRGLRTLTNPVINQYLNTHTDDMGRATVLSGASMVLALIGGGARILAGRAADVFGPVGFLPRAGLGLSILGGAIWFLTSPVRAPAEDETAHDADGPTPN